MDLPTVPREREWIDVGTGRRLHPYELYRIASVDYVEVVTRETDETGTVRRYVLLCDGEYEVWVEASARDTYGYDRRSDERVPEAEREAIELECAAVESDRTLGAEPTVSFSDAALRPTDELTAEDATGRPPSTC